MTVDFLPQFSVTLAIIHHFPFKPPSTTPSHSLSTTTPPNNFDSPRFISPPTQFIATPTAHRKRDLGSILGGNSPFYSSNSRAVQNDPTHFPTHLPQFLYPIFTHPQSLDPTRIWIKEKIKANGELDNGDDAKHTNTTTTTTFRPTTTPTPISINHPSLFLNNDIYLTIMSILYRTRHEDSVVVAPRLRENIITAFDPNPHEPYPPPLTVTHAYHPMSDISPFLSLALARNLRYHEFGYPIRLPSDCFHVQLASGIIAPTNPFLKHLLERLLISYRHKFAMAVDNKLERIRASGGSVVRIGDGGDGGGGGGGVGLNAKDCIDFHSLTLDTLITTNKHVWLGEETSKDDAKMKDGDDNGGIVVDPMSILAKRKKEWDDGMKLHDPLSYGQCSFNFGSISMNITTNQDVNDVYNPMSDGTRDEQFNQGTRMNGQITKPILTSHLLTSHSCFCYAMDEQIDAVHPDLKLRLPFGGIQEGIAAGAMSCQFIPHFYPSPHLGSSESPSSPALPPLVPNASFHSTMTNDSDLESIIHQTKRQKMNQDCQNGQNGQIFPTLSENAQNGLMDDQIPSSSSSLQQPQTLHSNTLVQLPGSPLPTLPQPTVLSTSQLPPQSQQQSPPHSPQKKVLVAKLLTPTKKPNNNNLSPFQSSSLLTTPTKNGNNNGTQTRLTTPQSATKRPYSKVEQNHLGSQLQSQDKVYTQNQAQSQLKTQSQQPQSPRQPNPQQFHHQLQTTPSKAHSNLNPPNLSQTSSIEFDLDGDDDDYDGKNHSNLETSSNNNLVSKTSSKTTSTSLSKPHPSSKLATTPSTLGTRHSSSKLLMKEQ